MTVDTRPQWRATIEQPCAGLDLQMHLGLPLGRRTPRIGALSRPLPGRRGEYGEQPDQRRPPQADGAPGRSALTAHVRRQLQALTVPPIGSPKVALLHAIEPVTPVRDTYRPAAP